MGGASEGPVTLAVRPERIRIAVSPSDGAPSTSGTTLAPVVDRAYLGDHLRYRVQLGDALLTVQSTEPAAVDGRLAIEIPAGCARAYPRPPAPPAPSEEQPDA
ncbi:hypothetical protein B7486_58475 [cyanobacterium TDX16]|nr:hypothetical protein B7486_58475 [cyanobacterium TDX16]